MSSDSWEEDGGTIGNKYVWKYYGLRDSEFDDPKTGEEREEIGIVVYRSGDDEDPIAYYSVGLAYRGDGPDPDQTKQEKQFIEQLRQATEKGEELQFLNREGLLLIDIPGEEKKEEKKSDTRTVRCI